MDLEERAKAHSAVKQVRNEIVKVCIGNVNPSKDESLAFIEWCCSSKMSEIEHGMSADSDVSAGVSTGHLSSSALSNLALNSEEIASYRLGDESRARE